MKQYFTPKKVKGNQSHAFLNDIVTANNVANLPFSTANGDARSDYDSAVAVPGVMVMRYAQTIGQAGGNDVVNQAAQAFFNYVTQGYTSTSVPVEGPDLFMYQLAVSALVSLFALGHRAYGVMTKYSPFNKYLAKVLVEACGFNFSNLQDNLENFRSRLNVMQSQVNQALHIMPDFRQLERWFNLNAHVYADSLTEWFQMYVFVPARVFKYSATASDTGTCLEYVNLDNYNAFDGGMTIAQYFNLLNSLIEPLIGDSDVNLMSASILRVYGESGVFKLPMLKEGYVQPIEYDPEALIQIHNTWMFGDITTNSVGQRYPVYQKSGLIVSQPVWQPNGSTPLPSNARLMQHNRIIDMVTSEYSDSDVAVALMATGCLQGSSTPSDPKDMAVVAVSEAMLDATILTLSSDNGSLVKYTFNSILDDTNENFLVTMQLLSAFDWHPFIYIKSEGVISACIGDTGNYTVVSTTLIQRFKERVAYVLYNAAPNKRSTTSNT